MKALILVDYENEWITKGSDYYLGDLSKLIENTNKLIDFCRKDNYKIIFIRHVEEDSTDSFAPNSKNVEFFEDLHKKDSDIIVTKYRISPFYNTNLVHHLNGVDQIVISGILTNLCVRSLIHDAYDRDFDITVIQDCCTAFDDDTHAFTLNDLKATRSEIQFLNLDEFCGE